MLKLDSKKIESPATYKLMVGLMTKLFSENNTEEFVHDVLSYGVRRKIYALPEGLDVDEVVYSFDTEQIVKLILLGIEELVDDGTILDEDIPKIVFKAVLTVLDNELKNGKKSKLRRTVH